MGYLQVWYDSSVVNYEHRGFMVTGLDVIKHFGGRKCTKSRFPLKLKQQELAIFRSLKSFRVKFCLKSKVFTFLCRFRHHNKVCSIS